VTSATFRKARKNWGISNQEKKRNLSRNEERGNEKAGGIEERSKREMGESENFVHPWKHKEKWKEDATLSAKKKKTGTHKGEEEKMGAKAFLNFCEEQWNRERKTRKIESGPGVGKVKRIGRDQKRRKKHTRSRKRGSISTRRNGQG